MVYIATNQTASRLLMISDGATRNLGSSLQEEIGLSKAWWKEMRPSSKKGIGK
jgi:hypothetical protein